MSIRPRSAEAGWLIAILAVGLVFRLFLAYVALPAEGFGVDVRRFASWALSLAYHGPGVFYQIAGFSDYPPGYLVLLWPLGLLSLAISPDDELVARNLVKIPAIVGDVGIALVSYHVGRTLAGRAAGLAAAAIYIFNPVSWFNSAVWAQVDSIGTLVLLLAIWALVKRQPELAAGLGALTLLIKPQYVALAPLIAAVIFRRYLWDVLRPRRTGEPPDSGLPASRFPVRFVTSAAAAFVPALLVLALFRQSPAEFLEHMRAGSDLYPYLSVNAFNPWATVSLLQGVESARVWESIPWRSDLTPIVGGVTPYAIGLALLVGCNVLVVRRVWMRDDPWTLYVAASALALAFFVLTTRMHERYAFPFFALALPLVIAHRRWFVGYVALSLATIANVYAVYSLPALRNPGAAAAELMDVTLLSPVGVALVSLVNLAGLIWVFRELSVSEEMGNDAARRAEAESSAILPGAQRVGGLHASDGRAVGSRIPQGG